MKLPDDVKEFFRRQGKIGAKKRTANLSPERRQEIARNAATARWARKVKETAVEQNKSKKVTK
jgi:hypothetical protein